jgi:Arabinose efflux permease
VFEKNMIECKRFPRNIWLLTLVSALAMAAAPLFILAGGLAGAELAPSPKWSTLPIACVVLGAATGMVPAIYILKYLGRKAGSYVGLCCLALSGLVCAWGCYISSFAALCGGAVILGLGSSFTQQFRFAVIESVQTKSQIASALSLLLLGSSVGVLLGTELGLRGQGMFGGAENFSGSFVLFVVVIMIAAIVLSGFRAPLVELDDSSEPVRPLLEIARQPLFLVALAAAAVGYAVMSFLMTSTPMVMHQGFGHSVADAKWVIQAHLLAMFLPSLVTGKLIEKIGIAWVLLLGALFYVFVLVVAMLGHQVMHFWWSLVLLGVGWNFLFVGGTTLLPQTYLASERHKVQALNDGVVFTMQATASLSAGWVVYAMGWSVQLLMCIPLVLVALVLALTLLYKAPVARV